MSSRATLTSLGVVAGALEAPVQPGPQARKGPQGPLVLKVSPVQPEALAPKVQPGRQEAQARAERQVPQAQQVQQAAPEPLEPRAPQVRLAPVGMARRFA